MGRCNPSLLFFLPTLFFFSVDSRLSVAFSLSAISCWEQWPDEEGGGGGVGGWMDGWKRSEKWGRVALPV